MTPRESEQIPAPINPVTGIGKSNNKYARDRAERLKHVNDAVSEIASRGRRFFWSKTKHRQARMIVAANGHLRWDDEYSAQHVVLSKHGRWEGFSNGGTLRSLVEAFALYVRKGTPVGSWRFGPWPDSYCGGDLWGYGKSEMADLRAALKSNPAILFPEEDPKFPTFSNRGARDEATRL